MTITRQDMLDVLKIYPKAKVDAAIFWFCFAWAAGKGSDFYRIMCETSFMPAEDYQFADDPEIMLMMGVLENTYRPQETPLRPVKIADVEEGDVLIAGSKFLCITNRWPSRVFKRHGALGVMCKGATTLAGPHQRGFHALQADDLGFVIGFRR